MYNGLLLSPNLDACFDSGFISFDDAGNILISSQ
ncbi:MAG: HNH endonuclease, partial [Candidatus Latescibacterota bacterium]